MRQPFRILSGGAALLVLTSTARDARAGGVSSREEHVFRSVNDLPNALHGPLWAVMQSGSLAAVFVASGVQARRQPAARTITVLLAGVAVWAGVKAVKPLVGRGRPAAELDHVSVRGEKQSGLGYPSGHSAVAATLALALAHDRGTAAGACALGVAALTGGARMYVGAHLPLDVAGGLAIGALGGGLAIRALDGLVERS
jgi:membrane-associated phospholipid phosphatase